MMQNKNTWFYIGGSGLDQTGDFPKFCGSALDWIQFYQIRIGLGLKNFTVRSFSVVHHHSIPSVPYICKLCVVEVRDVVLLCLYCCRLYILVCINISWCLFTYWLGLDLQLLLVDIASLASCCFVIRSLIGNIAFSFMFYCMNLVDCIFWIYLLVGFLVMCGFIFPSLCFVKLRFSERKWL